MYTANDIRNIRFSKSMSGYKQEEVDSFLDKVEEDYNGFDAKVRDLEGKVSSLSKQVEDLNVSQNSIQNVLVSAQKLADQIVGEAKEKAEQIIVEAKMRAGEINRATDEKAAEDMAAAERNKREAEAEYVKIMQKTAEKSETMISAAHDSVARQQLLFDKLKLDIVNFKSQIMAIYKEHIEALSKLPDEVPFDSVRAAEAAAFAFENAPDYSAPVAPVEVAPAEVAEEAPAVSEEPAEENTVAQQLMAAFAEDASMMPAPAEEPAQEPATDSEPVLEPDVPLGFKVNLSDEEEEEPEEYNDKPAKGFFKRKR